VIAGLRWLKDYVEFDLPARDVARLLTEHLTETVVVVSPSADVRGIVSAKVVTVEPHPDAETLSVCVVDWGGGSSTVVCGAPNVRPGATAAYAPDGSMIAGGRRIGEQTIRGRRSQGMLVSAAELGLEESSDGIIELPDTLLPGEDLRDTLGLGDEAVELDVQANRPDCLGMIGVARELASIVGSALSMPRYELKESAAAAGERVSVTVEDTDACPGYIARLVEGVSIGPSPAWLQTRLRSAGQRSISNIVDATNFVMLEYGHPVHGFDLDRLRERHIIVRRARRGESLRTLDGEDRSLLPSHLLICDGEVPIALAGIMGGGETEVGPTTTSVLLECAWFDPKVVRKGALELKLSTEASHRFERGIDPSLMGEVAERACAMMADVAGGEVAAGAVESRTGKPVERTIELKISKVESMLGPGDAQGRGGARDEIAAQLGSLGFRTSAIEIDGDPGLAVAVPTHRPDVEVPADLLEEIARIRGYDTVVPELPFHDSIAAMPRERARRSAVRDAMLGLGFTEVVTTAFMREDSLGKFGGGPATRPIGLSNPVNKEFPLMRTTIIAPLLEVVLRNMNVGESDLRLFEIGKVYERTDSGAVERWVLAGALAGSAVRASWAETARATDLYDVKGVLWALAEALDIDSPEASCYDGPMLDESASAGLLLGGGRIGQFGLLSKRTLKAWELPAPVWIFEVDLEEITARCEPVRVFEPLPRYPGSQRDIALVLDDGVGAGVVTAEIRGLEEPLLEALEVFDVYRGEQLPVGKKSLGLSLTYLSRERTLTDREVDEAHARVVEHLMQRFGASLRN